MLQAMQQAAAEGWQSGEHRAGGWAGASEGQQEGQHRLLLCQWHSCKALAREPRHIVGGTAA